MDAGECFLASPGQDERSPWSLDLNLPHCPSATKDSPLLPPSPVPSSPTSSSAPNTGGGYKALSTPPVTPQPPLLVNPSPLYPTYLPKQPPPAEPNCQEEDEGEALHGHVLFASDGSVYLLKGKGEEEEALPPPASPRGSSSSTVLLRPPLTSFRLTSTYQGFCSNQISRHTSAGTTELTQTAPGTSPRNRDQPKEKEAGEQVEETDRKSGTRGESFTSERVEGVWICLPCQFTFRCGDKLGWHAYHSHGLKHPFQDQLAMGETSGIVHGSNGQLFLSLLEPKISQREVLDAVSEPENVKFPGAQTIPPLEATQSMRDQPRASKNLTCNMDHTTDEIHGAAKRDSESSHLHSLTLGNHSPPKQNLCDPSGKSHSTEAKDSKAHMEEKNRGTTWCPTIPEAQSEGGEEEDEEGEGLPQSSQPPDITEQLLTNQSFYGQMMTSSFPQLRTLHGTEKQTESDRGPNALDDCTPTSSPQPFQSLSLQGQLSLLHSRNSCKTLKCPKCNWHYKYQQTLDVHMKEKHPESHSHCSYCHTGQQHPRLARGESYNCGYKPYRCEACNYSTTTKGNLTIHMQSDKHLANLQGYQGPGANSSTAAPPLVAPGVSAGQGEASQPSPPDRQLKQKASWHCKVCNYETNISRNLRIHMTSEKHMQNVLLLHQGLGMGQDTFPFYGGPLAPEQGLDHSMLFSPMHFSSGGPACNLLTAESSTGPQMSSLGSSTIPITTPASLQNLPSSPTEEEPSPGVFRCLICRCFTTDSLEGLLSHASRGRSLPEREWREVRGDLHCCRLCSYSTQLKANFQLHLKTDKHAQKYQLAAHMREGGAALAAAQASAAELPISGYSQAASFPPLHLYCNLCGFESNSREKIQLHVQGGGHEESLRVYKFLQTLEDAETNDACFRCSPCDSNVDSRLGMMSHLRSTSHHQNLAQWRLTKGDVGLEGIITVCRNPQQEQVKRTSSPEITSNPKLEEENKDTPQAPVPDESAKTDDDNSGEGTTVFCCPFCAYVSPSEDTVHNHAVSQHALQPTFRCPLCQEQLTGSANLRGHLGHGHNVVSECVEKLLLVAQKVEISFRTRILPVRVREEVELPVSENRPSCEAPNTATDTSPPDSPRDITPSPAEHLGDAEKSPEDTPCPLCRLPTESCQDLKMHLEKDHPEISPSEIQQACEARGRELEVGELEEKRELQENIPAPLQQATYRKTTNFAMDKFMDPSRPHKCVVCKESFTQKNILLVHYNSVSHLHKVRKASLDPSISTRQEPGVGPPGLSGQTGQDKPYKCTICHVSYNQSSTLEIHMRSVLHQTRSRGAKVEVSKLPPEKPQKDTNSKNETAINGKGESTGEPQGLEVNKRHHQLAPCLGVPILPPSVASSTMQLSLDMPRPPPLVQPTPLFAPSLLPSFPLIPEAILKLQRQQQQLLLPFYLQELKVSSDGGVSPLMPFGSTQQPLPIKDEGGQPSVTPSPVNQKEEKSQEEQNTGTGENTISQSSENGVDPNTKGAGELTGSAARALLENFGFELVTQYNEGRQPATAQPQIQPQPPAPPPDASPKPSSTEKLQCGTCGKHFSNRLILKTHEEHMHQRLLPFEALSRYAAHYRRNYDSHYPVGMIAETTGPSATPLDFSMTSQGSRGVEEQEAANECAMTAEQLSFLHNLLDLTGHTLEEGILWVADKTALPPAAIRQWYSQREKSFHDGHEEEEEETSRADRLGIRRFSRTKFSEFQTQSLNSFFEYSAYPRDSEVEHLSGLLELPGRVVVVWFQNARQKARKHAVEGSTSALPLNSSLSGEHLTSNNKVPICRKCGVILPCIFQLIHHLKGCYSDQSDEVPDEEEKEEVVRKIPEEDESVTDQTLMTEPSSTTVQEKQEEEKGDGPEEKEIKTVDTTASVEAPTSKEQNVQPQEQSDHQTEQKESSIPTDQNQNQSLSDCGHLSTPLMDLSLLIPVASGDMASQRKRKHEEESLSPTGSEGGDEPPRDKRLRTTILPEQLDILHRWYLQDSNPTRSTLERISLEVGLKKRVVQVWFQNTRARERKGQYRGVTPLASSVPRQQEDVPKDGVKREVPTSYYYSVGPNQVAPPLTVKAVPSTGQTNSPLISKPQVSSSLAPTVVTNKPLVTSTQALTGLLNATQVIPSIVSPSQAISGLVNSTQALTNLVAPPQALSGLVNSAQAFPGLVNPAQMLSSLVNTQQTSTGLLLASFTAKPPAQPILLSATLENKSQPSPSSSQILLEHTVESDKALANSNLQTSVPAKISAPEQQAQPQITEVQSLETHEGGSERAPKNTDISVHSPQGGDLSDSSGSDPGPPSPGKGGMNSESLLGSSGARRYRTQMSSLQLRILKACYTEYRTPSMQECDSLGGEIGLQKRVVQVWFQNARAKEKKARLQGFGGTTTNEGPQPTECTHCNIKYGPTTPCRAHIFSRQHIARLRLSIQQQLKEESRYRDTHPAGVAPSGPDSKPTSQILSFQGPTSVTPQIQRITPLLMPGQGIPAPIPAPIGGLATFNTGPPPSLLGMTSSVPSALLPRAAPHNPSSSQPPADTIMDGSKPTTTPDTSGPPALKASLLGTPFMPFPLAPTATPLFSPQIQGPYFQQLYGLKKRLFPINPVIPHTLLGLLPGPLKPVPESSPLIKQVSPKTKATSESSEGQEERPVDEEGEEEGMDHDDDPEDEDIPMVDVAMRYQCQRCKTSYEEEGEAEAHQRAGCYTGPPPHPPPLRLRVCTYHCLSCQVLLQGPMARSQHLRSQQHRAHSVCNDGASSAIPQLRPKSAATSVLMAL
ncbi:zinc finger homeobox protein 2 [Discoglossus pictus]